MVAPLGNGLMFSFHQPKRSGRAKLERQTASHCLATRAVFRWPPLLQFPRGACNGHIYNVQPSKQVTGPCIIFTCKEVYEQYSRGLFPAAQTLQAAAIQQNNSGFNRRKIKREGKGKSKNERRERGTELVMD